MLGFSFTAPQCIRRYCACFFSNKRRNTIIHSESSIVILKLDDKKLLTKKPETKLLYADVINETKKSLNTLIDEGLDNIVNTINHFNHIFSEMSLSAIPFSHEDLIEDVLFTSLDDEAIKYLEQKVSDLSNDSIVNKNIYNAFLEVYRRMNKNCVSANLIYHTGRHGAAEAPSDIHTIMSDSSFPEDLRCMYLLMLLCVLFHDAEFERDCINDEIKSALALKNFLKTVLEQLNNSERQIIEALIQVIIPGGSISLFFNQPEPVIENVFQVATSFLSDNQKQNNVYKFCAIFAQLMRDVDINRTSIPALHQKFQQNEGFMLNQGYWKILNKQFYHQHFYETIDSSLCEQDPHLFEALKWRLTQGLRVMAENMAESMVSNDTFSDKSYFISKDMIISLITGCQRNTPREVTVSEEDITFFANEIKKEISFADRMKNSCVPLCTRSYTLVNHWSVHAQLLQNIYHFLTNDGDHSFEERKEVVVALAHVAADQPGCFNIITNIDRMVDYTRTAIKENNSNTASPGF